MNSCSSSGMGFRFRPVDDELISYLIKFVSGNPFDSPHIRVLDLYGNKKPSDIFHDLSPDGESTDVNYLITPLKKKSAQGKNVNRLGGGGTWKGLDAAKEVLSNKGSVIGFKKNFRYYDNEDGRNLGHDHQRVVWTMKEYRLSHSIMKALRGRNQIRHEDFVLCRIKKKAIRSHVINNCDGENNISVVTEGEQAMLGLGGYVGADAQNHETVPISNSEKGYGAIMNVHGGDHHMMNGFCDKEENIGSASSWFYQEQVGVCSSENYNSHQEITNISGENINVVSGDQPMPMVGYCLEYDQNYDDIEYSSSCVPTSNSNICDGINEFELREVDEQEFERAKASVPLLEESLAELSNILLQGSDDNDRSYFNLLGGLTYDQSSQQLPDHHSSADYGVEFPHHEFELLEVDEQEFERVKASVPMLEESLSELSNILLQGSNDNDQYYNLLRGLTYDQSSQQLPADRDEAPMSDQLGISSSVMMMTTNQDNQQISMSHELPMSNSFLKQFLL